MSALEDYVAARLAERGRIARGRRRALATLARGVAGALRAGSGVDLLFVCTHNSRRSIFGQVWAAVAAARFGLLGVRAWSGGTEATALAPAAAAALARAGLFVEREGADANPVHLVRTGPGAAPLRCWSKRVDDPANPRQGVLAIMTCAEADAACPAVPGAVLRVALPYADPKVADGAADEAAVYDARCAEIAREMLWLLGR